MPSDVNDEETIGEEATAVAVADATETETETETGLPADTIIASARAHVLETSQSLVDSSLTGIFLTTPSNINKLDLACRQLEAITPTMSTAEQDLLLGEWDLVCTARAPKLPLQNIDRTSSKSTSSNEKKESIFDLLPKPPKLQDSIRNSLSVRQRIRAKESSSDEEDDNEPSNDITRVDHVLEYTPLTLSQLIPESSPLAKIRSWNVNPLEVSKSKVTLIHTASVESTSPVFRTKLNLQSVVVTVAGTSSYLDPNGADLLGLNIPSIGEWSNSGYFDTTFVDESLRISRGSTLGWEELRVFVKTPKSEHVDIVDVDADIKQEAPEEDRAQKVKEAVEDVKSAVVNLEQDVKTKVQDAAKEVQEVVQEDLKEIGDKVTKVREAVVGKELVLEESKDEEDAVQEVEAVAEEEEESKDEEDAVQEVEAVAEEEEESKDEEDAVQEVEAVAEEEEESKDEEDVVQEVEAVDEEKEDEDELDKELDTDSSANDI